MKMRLTFLLALCLGAWASSGAHLIPPQENKIDPAVLTKVAQTLAGSRVAEPQRTRGASLTNLYWNNVRNAPVVVADGGTGSATVIIVNANKRAYVLTNNHVATHAFTLQNATPGVFLLFYDPALNNEIFDSGRFGGCFMPNAPQDAWCRAVKSQSRWATVIGTDPARDLALLSVDNIPSGVEGIPPANLQSIQPGDEVVIIGSPKSLLWSLTTGIVSAVRANFQLGTSTGTMIQTQAPVNPGNSGGPMISPDGKLVGVIFAGSIDQQFVIGKEQVAVPSEGLNYAIGIDQVLAFTRSQKLP